MPPSLAVLPLEIPTFSSGASENAISLGASRIELSAPGSYPAGGLTPRPADLPTSAASLPVPFRIMIRPRGAADNQQDFVYSDAEFAAMRDSVREFKACGLLHPERGDGFVFGIVKHAGQDGGAVVVDEQRCEELVRLAGPFGCTYHRAFDDVLDSAGPGSEAEALESVARCGFDAILTSGGKGNALENREMLRNLIQVAKGKIQIIVGGGVRSTNVVNLARDILPNAANEHIPGEVWFHSSCLTPKSKGPEEPDEDELTRMVDRLQSIDHRQG